MAKKMKETAAPATAKTGKRGVNITVFTGNMGKDPEMKYVGDGKAVTKFSIAVNNRDETLWLNLVCWERLAETVNEYGKKGRKVLVQGRLKDSSYEKDGVKHKAVELVATEVQFLHPKPALSEAEGPAENEDPDAAE